MTLLKHPKIKPVKLHSNAGSVQSRRAMVAWLLRYKLWLSSTAAALVVVSAVIAVVFGNTRTFSAWVNETPVVALTPLPLRAKDANHDLVLRLANYSGQTVRVIGALPECGGGLEVRNEMPFAIPPVKSVGLQIQVAHDFKGCPDGQDGKPYAGQSALAEAERKSRIRIFTDCREFRELEIPVVVMRNAP